MKALLALVLLAAPATAQTYSLVSTRADGSQIQADSWPGPMTPDARFVVFYTTAPDVMPGAPNGGFFRKDTVTGEVVFLPYGATAITADGGTVLFETLADDIGPGDLNMDTDVYAMDVATGALEAVSVNNVGDLGDGGCSWSSISADGHYVAFLSTSTTLAPVGHDFYAEARDVFLRDRWTGTTVLASFGNGNAWGPVISADGSAIAYKEDYWIAAYNVTGQAVEYPLALLGEDGGNISISANGQRISFGTDSAWVMPDFWNTPTMYLFDRASGVTSGVSVDAAGQQSSGTYGTISGDGRFVAYGSDYYGGQTLLRDLDHQSSASYLPAGPSVYRLSYDSTLALLRSDDPLIPGDTNGFRDVYLFDRTPLRPDARLSGQTRLPGGHPFP